MYSKQHPISRRHGTVERKTAFGVTEERLMFAAKQFQKEAAASDEESLTDFSSGSNMTEGKSDSA
jgi:hypothetical protein